MEINWLLVAFVLMDWDKLANCWVRIDKWRLTGSRLGLYRWIEINWLLVGFVLMDWDKLANCWARIDKCRLTGYRLGLY